MDEQTKVDKAVVTPTPTAGDEAPAAAAPIQPIAAHYIPYPTPGDEKDDQSAPSAMMPAYYLHPPENPDWCWNTYDLSPYLEPHIAAIDANVYSSGFSINLDPELDCDEPQLWNKVADALAFSHAPSPEQIKEPGKIEVRKHLEALDKRIKWESRYLSRFFASCSAEMPFPELVSYLGQDLEVTGNAYIEVLRDTKGRIARFIWSPARMTRAIPLTPADRRVAYEQVVRDPILGFYTEPQYRRFRRYVQLAKDTNTVQTYFKEFGDPRVVSRRTGAYYRDLAELRTEEPEALPATEIYHLRQTYAGSTVYGKTCWSGIGAAMRGARDLDEENLKFIKDEVLPSLLLMVAGPRIHDDELKRFEQQIEDRANSKGRGVLIFNAYSQQYTPGVPTQAANMLVERMKSEQINDSIFSNYDQRSEEKAHLAFRLPAIALGIAGRRMDKTIALVLRRFAEDQVYAPRREWLARQLNVLLDHMRVQCMRWSAKAVPPRDPEALANIIQILMDAGVLTPDEGRNLAEVIFNSRLSNLPGVWSTLPTKLLIAVLQTKNPTLAAALLQQDESISMEKLGEILQQGLSEAAEQVQGEDDDDEGPSRRSTSEPEPDDDDEDEDDD